MVSQVKPRVADDQDVFLELARKMNHARSVGPAIDAHEVDGLIQMTAEVPGVPESAIDVCLDGDILTINVEKGDQNKGKRVHFSERSYGQFTRSIQLPFAPDPDSVEASVRDGLLTILFPRVDRERARHIAIGGVRPEEPEEEEEQTPYVSEWADMTPNSQEPVTLDVKATRLLD